MDRQERRRMRERGAGLIRDLKNTGFAFTFGNTKTPTANKRKSKTPTTKRNSKTPTTKRNSKTPTTKGNSKTPSSVTGKRKRDGTPIVPDVNEEDELEQEDVMEKITGRRSWGEQMPAPRRSKSLAPVNEEATGEDELEQADAEHDISHTSRLSLVADAVRRSEERLRPSSKAVTAELGLNAPNAPAKTPKTAKPTKTPKTARPTNTPTTKRRDPADPEVEEHGKENETHSTFIRRMYKPRQPLQAVDGSARMRRGPVAPMLEASSVAIEPAADERSSMIVLDEAADIEDSIDPGLEDVTAGPSAILDARTLSASRLGIPHGTPLFLTPGDSTLHLPNTWRDDDSPARGRKRRRTGSFAAAQDGESSQAGEVPEKTKTKRPKAKARPEKRQPSPIQPDGTNAIPRDEGEDEQQSAIRGSGRLRGAPAATVPITVYRLSKPPAADDDEDELNEAAVATSSARLPAVNPADVLTQITTEVIEHMVETVHRLPLTANPRSSTTSTANRKPDATELKRKRAILHHFKQSLSDSLFDVTTALDAGNALSTRLRTLTKEKIQLREELLAVRKQREGVALKIDRVRRNHASWREKTTNRDELSAELWDIEMAVKSGREECERRRAAGEEVREPEMGLDMLSVMMAENAGGAMSGGGLCGKVQHLNDLLESAAEVLERRIT